MRAAACLTLLALVAGVAAWDHQDFEIFDLVSALKADGHASFYSFMNVAPGATVAEIARAYRKRSLELHPDKNPGVPGAQERFARLGVINAILKDSERRERYNFFFKNGVPTWKGLSYAYTRWRPGLGLVLVFIVLLTSAAHYLVQHMNYSRDRARVAYFVSSAQRLARGAAGRRKVRVPMVEGTVGGETLELVVEDGNVYLPHEDGSLTSLDELAPQPSIKRTWPVALARRLLGKKEPAAEEWDGEAEADEPEVDEVEGFAVEEKEAPRSRAAQLRAQRAKKGPKKSREGTPATATEGESEAADEATDTTDAENKPRRRGPGKASAARRRKMNK